MRMLGDIAGKHGITLVLENHFHTMTTTAANTARIMKEINHPYVGILYDQANLAFLHAEEYKEAIALQKDYIRYVHAKDLVYRPGNKTFRSMEVSHINEEDRIVFSRVIGQGHRSMGGDYPGTAGILRRLALDGIRAQVDDEGFASGRHRHEGKAADVLRGLIAQA